MRSQVPKRSPDIRYPGTLLDGGRPGYFRRGCDQGFLDQLSIPRTGILPGGGHEEGSEPGDMRRGLAGPAFHLIADVPAGNRRVRESRRDEVGFRELPSARAEIRKYIGRGCDARLGRSREHTGK